MCWSAVKHITLHMLWLLFQYSSYTLLQPLNWLPAEYHANFKIGNITFCTLHCSQPAYSDLHAHHFTHSLRLSNTNLLSVPFVRTSSGTRSFSVAALQFGNQSVQLFECGPAPTPFVVISRLAISSSSSNQFDNFLLRLIFGFCWPLCMVINYTYLLNLWSQWSKNLLHT